TAEGVLRLRLDPGGREPVRALPAHLAAEAGAPIPQPLVEWRAAQPSPALRLAIGKGHEVVHAHDLAHPLAEELGIGVEGREPADVRLPETHGRAILDDPL